MMEESKSTEGAQIPNGFSYNSILGVAQLTHDKCGISKTLRLFVDPKRDAEMIARVAAGHVCPQYDENHKPSEYAQWG